jgi:hypothetical protein
VQLNKIGRTVPVGMQNNQENIVLSEADIFRFAYPPARCGRLQVAKEKKQKEKGRKREKKRGERAKKEKK